jgi:hypothetical protein
LNQERRSLLKNISTSYVITIVSRNDPWGASLECGGEKRPSI